jgi:outer membrane protein assembly factor BamE
MRLMRLMRLMLASSRRAPGRPGPTRPPPALALALAVGGLALSLAGCASSRQTEDGFFSRITPYRIEIVQGNVVTREQLARVRPGLSRAQVRDVLGTPLLTDPFHGDRWDYIFTLRRDGAPPQRRSVIAHFQGDALTSVEAPPDLPSGQEFVKSISVSSKTPQAPVLELTQAQIQALPAPSRREEAAAAEPAAPARSYPPVGN